MTTEFEKAQTLAAKIRQGLDISEDELVDTLKLSDEPGRLYYALLSQIGQQRSLHELPATLKRIIKTEAWRHWRWMKSDFSAPSLGTYLERHPPNGLGAKLEIVEKLVEDDAEALAMFREATTGKKHAHADGDNITIKPERGTSKAYILDRLKRERPDLFRKVAAKELSANAAAIEAGWRRKPSALENALKAFRKLTNEERRAFLDKVAK
jgi:hypothetical protein